MCAFPSNQLSHVLVRLLFAWLLVLLIVYLCSLLLWILRFFPKGARYRWVRVWERGMRAMCACVKNVCVTCRCES